MASQRHAVANPPGPHPPRQPSPRRPPQHPVRLSPGQTDPRPCDRSWSAPAVPPQPSTNCTSYPIRQTPKPRLTLRFFRRRPATGWPLRHDSPGRQPQHHDLTHRYPLTPWLPSQPSLDNARCRLPVPGLADHRGGIRAFLPFDRGTSPDTVAECTTPEPVTPLRTWRPAVPPTSKCYAWTPAGSGTTRPPRW
jgi:hypothetical protein